MEQGVPSKRKWVPTQNSVSSQTLRQVWGNNKDISHMRSLIVWLSTCPLLRTHWVACALAKNSDRRVPVLEFFYTMYRWDFFLVKGLIRKDLCCFWKLPKGWNLFLKKKKKIIYLFMAALGLRCCMRAFSSCGEQGLLFVAVCGLLIVVASLVAEHRL